MNQIQKAALDEIKAAIAGKAARSLAEVTAGDVVLAGQLLKAPDEVCGDLLLGASRCNKNARVFAEAAKLKHLVEEVERGNHADADPV